MQKRKMSIYEKYIKRTFDFILALTAFVILSPIMLLIAIAIRINMGAPILYCQKRAGYLEKEFTIYKFRTMNNRVNKKGEMLSDNELLPDNDRITLLGSFLRKTSLDELPQLINIIKGDLSIIGPRPLLMEYLTIYTKKEHRRHLVKPGLVGLAVVNGRNAQSWDSKFEYDVAYVDNISLKLDIHILFKCLKTVLGQKGIYSNDEMLVEDSFIKRVEKLNAERNADGD